MMRRPPASGAMATDIYGSAGHAVRRGNVRHPHRHPDGVSVRAAQDEVHHQDLAPEHLLANGRHLLGERDDGYDLYKITALSFATTVS